MRLLKIAVTVLALLLLAGFAYAYYSFRGCDPERLTLDGPARASAEVRAFGGSYVRLAASVTHYELAGPPAAQTVVLVPGFSVPYYIWDPTFQVLASSGFRVLRYDLYGRGWSDRPSVHYNPDLFDQQLLQLLVALGIRRPVDIAGVSMGGPITATFAARHPERVRKLVFFDPAFGKGIAPPWQFRAPWISDFVMCTEVEPTLALAQRADFVHPGRYPAYFADYLPQMRYRGFRHALLSTLRDYLSQNNEPDFVAVGRSGKPILLVWGRADKDVPFAVSQEVRKAIPQAEFLAVDDAAHVPFYEHPEIVTPVLIAFLRR